MRSDTQLWTRHEMDMGEGMPEEVFHMPATPEEIKEAHGKCGTCEHHWYGEHTAYRHLCSQDRLRGVDPTKSYCNHHEPKEL